MCLTVRIPHTKLFLEFQSHGSNDQANNEKIIYQNECYNQTAML